MLFEASGPSVKKPAKPKPKRRARTPAPAHVVARAGSTGVGPPASGAQLSGPRAAPRAQPIAVAASARGGKSSPLRRPFTQSVAAAAPAYSHDDRTALALLLLPFLIVATSLATGHAWRQTLQLMPEIVARTPVPSSPYTPSLAAQAPVVQGRITYPSAVPVIEVARIQPAPTPLIPPTVLAYPSIAPVIPPPSANVASLDVRPVPMPLPPPALAPNPAAPVTGETCQPSGAKLASFSLAGRLARNPRQPRISASDPAAFGQHLATAALTQTRDFVIYSARYQPMAYPMGDVLAMQGACTDVIIRAYRSAGIDLQELVQRTRSGRGDPNIDHRRTETLRTFLARHGESLPVTAYPEDYKPGDIVTYHRPFSRVSNSHIAVVTDVLAPTGRPMIVHNRGYGPQLEDALFVDRITGHYRYAGPAAAVAEPEIAQAARAHGELRRAGFSATATARQSMTPRPNSIPNP